MRGNEVEPTPLCPGCGRAYPLDPPRRRCRCGAALVEAGDRWEMGPRFGRAAPHHPHDCVCCAFLGTYDDHDLYYCVSQRFEMRDAGGRTISVPSVRVRWGITLSATAPAVGGSEMLSLETGQPAAALRVAALIVRDAVLPMQFPGGTEVVNG